MKYFLCLAAFSVLTLASIGQDAAKTETEIRILEQAGVTAILTGDTNTLKQIWAPEFMVNSPRNEITGTRDSVLMLQKTGMLHYSTYEKNIERIQVQGNIVITMGNEVIVSKNNTPAAKAGQVIKRRFTNIWMKKNGQWQQIARHASIICQ